MFKYVPEAEKPDPLPRQKAFGFLVLFLLMAATITGWTGYMMVTRQSLLPGDFLLFAGGISCAASVFFMWRRWRFAPSMEYLRQSAVPPAEQVAAILGWGGLCAGNLFPSTTLGGTPPLGNHYGYLLFAGVTGLQAFIGLFFFIQERRRLRQTRR